MLIVGALQEGDDRFGNGTLATSVELIDGAYLITRTTEVVAKGGLYILLYILLTFSRSSQLDTSRGDLCSLDAFRVVVGNLGTLFGCFQGLF